MEPKGNGIVAETLKKLWQQKTALEKWQAEVDQRAARDIQSIERTRDEVQRWLTMAIRECCESAKLLKEKA